MSDAVSTAFWAVWYFQGGTDEATVLAEPEYAEALPENFRADYRGIIAGSKAPERWEAALRLLVTVALAPLSDSDLVAGATDIADALRENAIEGGASDIDDEDELETDHRNTIEDLLTSVGGFLGREING